MDIYPQKVPSGLTCLLGSIEMPEVVF